MPKSSRPSAPGGLKLDALVDEIADLRPFPMAAARILTLTESDRFSAQDLAAAIAADQSLAANLLRLANSAYYGFPRRIGTVRDAVVLVGFRAARQAMLVTCLSAPARPTNNLDESMFWRRSVIVGLLAESIAARAREPGEQGFIAGLLHDVGLLAFDQYRPDELREAILAAHAGGITLSEAERILYGFTDAELGGALAERWGLPPDLVRAIRDHDGPLGTLSEPVTLAGVVSRARLLASAAGVTRGIIATRARGLEDAASLDDGDGPLEVSAVLDRAEALLSAAMN